MIEKIQGSNVNFTAFKISSDLKTSNILKKVLTNSEDNSKVMDTYKSVSKRINELSEKKNCDVTVNASKYNSPLFDYLLVRIKNPNIDKPKMFGLKIFNNLNTSQQENVLLNLSKRVEQAIDSF